jgi:hypothetical protein
MHSPSTSHLEIVPDPPDNSQGVDECRPQPHIWICWRTNAERERLQWFDLELDRIARLDWLGSGSGLRE